MNTIKPDRTGLLHLMTTLQKARSISAELGLTEVSNALPGFMWVNDDRTVELLSDLVSGDKKLDVQLWVNLMTMVSASPTWEVSLAYQGLALPDNPLDQYLEETPDARS